VKPTKAGQLATAFAIMQSGDTRAHLSLLALAPGLRRRGIGRRAMTGLEESALTAGITTVALELRQQRGCTQLLPRAGLQRCGLHPRLLSRGRDGAQDGAGHRAGHGGRHRLTLGRLAAKVLSSTPIVGLRLHGHCARNKVSGKAIIDIYR